MISNRLTAALSICVTTAFVAWLPVVTAAPVLPANASAAVTAHLFADGSVDCTGASDLSERVGRVILRPVANGIAFRVVLTGAAANWDYYVELSQSGNCSAAQQFHGFTTSGNGKGVFTGVYPARSGSYALLVDVVSDPPSLIPPNPKHREIAPSGLLSLNVW